MLTAEQFDRLTTEEQDEYLAIRQEELNYESRENIVTYAQQINQRYRPAWFHYVILNALQEVLYRRRNNLLILTPPQHGKSEAVSIITPTFALGINPDEKIIACSYNNDLTVKWNTAIQNVMDSEIYKNIFPNTRIPDKNVRTQAGKYMRNSDIIEIVDHSGFYYCTGVGGGISGRSMTLGIIDDPVKGAEDANSPTIRQKLEWWYDSEFGSRENPGLRIVMIMTRWNEEDLANYVLTKSRTSAISTKWDIIKLPAALDSTDNLPPYEKRRTVGEGLWLDYHGQEYYDRKRADSDPYYWSALYQQEPRAREGNVIKREWFTPYVYTLPTLPERVIYFDLGASDNPSADSTVGTVLARDKEDVEYMLWQLGGRWNIFQRNKEIASFCERWDKIFPGIGIYIEAGIGEGATSVEDLRNSLLAKGLNAHTDRVTTSKYNRASAETGSFFASAQSGRIKIYAGEQFREQGFVNPLLWIDEFFDEVTRLQFHQGANGVEFVGGHDDRLDSPVGAHNKLTKTATFDISLF